MRVEQFRNLSLHVAANIEQALSMFAPEPTANALCLSMLWSECGLDMLEEREWRHVVTVGEEDAETLPWAIGKLSRLFANEGVTPSMRARGAVLIPNGRYVMEDELTLHGLPHFDLIGESRDGVVVTHGGLKKTSTIWCRRTSTLMANMTIERTGAFAEPTGYGVRYPIHVNYPAAGPRSVIFSNLNCKTTAAVQSNGVGTGISQGGVHLFANVNADYGFFNHNGDEWSCAFHNHQKWPEITEPGAGVYINCTAGLNPEAGRPPTAFRHWNVGTGQPDLLAIIGGEMRGANYGLQIIDFQSPFHGDSETEFLDGGCKYSGSQQAVSVTDRTVWRVAL